MKLLTFLLLTIAFTPITSFVAKGADAPGRPPGVSATGWIAITDKLGFVVVSRSNTPEVPTAGQGSMLTRPVEGYFMVKGAMGWRRVVLVEPPTDPTN